MGSAKLLRKAFGILSGPLLFFSSSSKSSESMPEAAVFNDGSDLPWPT